MPFESEKQRRFMHAKHPEIARRWEHEYHGKMKPATGRMSQAARVHTFYIDRAKFTGEEGSWSGWEGDGTQQGRKGVAGEGDAESAWADDPAGHTESELAGFNRQLRTAKMMHNIDAPVGASSSGAASGMAPSLAGLQTRMKHVIKRDDLLLRPGGAKKTYDEVAKLSAWANGVQPADPGLAFCAKMLNLTEWASFMRRLEAKQADDEPEEKGPTENDAIGNKAPFTNEQFLAAMHHERGRTDGESDMAVAKRVKTHLDERPNYYEELAQMVNPDHANLVGKMGDMLAYKMYRAQGHSRKEADRLAGQGPVGKMKHDVSFSTSSKMLVGDDDGAEEDGYDSHPAAHVRVDDIWRDDLASFNGQVLTVPKALTTPAQAVFADDIQPERPLRCGNCAAYSGGSKLTGKCSRIQSPGHEAGKLLKVHFFNYCTIHRPKGAGGPLGEKLGALDSKRPMAKADSGPFLGPKGGMWKDAKHTIPYKRSDHVSAKRAELASHEADRPKPKKRGLLQKLTGRGKDSTSGFRATAHKEKAADISQDIKHHSRALARHGDAQLHVNHSDPKHRIRHFEAMQIGAYRSLRKAGGTNIAPIGGSSPREETPPLPDYGELYYQPKDSEHKQREAEQNATRRAADAQRNTAVYGFHGEAGNNLSLEPVLRYETDPRNMKQTVYGDAPLLAQRKPVILSDEVQARLKAGASSYDKDAGKTDHGRVARSADRRNDTTVPDEGGRPLPVDDGLDVDVDEDEDEGEVAEESHIATYAELYEDDDDDDEDDEDDDDDENDDRLSEVQDRESPR